ncbi:OPA3-domain-containing protein [Athelia psychrophila]|uniref:OPA3-domain-containing protein n=2 Tax=Athelia psychrophila TaxID=1759441 RepID=A0A166PBL2_9AGAM|nr:OPA3-domain-containing protein [Fibularhizoctonia sp. CBS 109695]
MASVKLVTLAVRTAAKPISNMIKRQAKEHERFRGLCMTLAQSMHRGEIILRTKILGEPARSNVKPLSEARAIENGANALAEGFLFGVAALLILGETWRSSRSQSKRRDNIDDQLEELAEKLSELTTRVETVAGEYEGRWEEERIRNDELARILERVVEIGLRGGWSEFEDTPLQLPRIQLAPPPSHQRLDRAPDSPPGEASDSKDLPPSSDT